MVSLISYVVAGLGLFRLLHRLSRTAAWVGTAMFAINPNLLYVQSTALNEPLYLACFLWAAVFFVTASSDAVQRLTPIRHPPDGEALAREKPLQKLAGPVVIVNEQQGSLLSVHVVAYL